MITNLAEMKEKSSMCFISPSIIWISIHNTSLKCKHDYYCSSSFRNWGSSSSVVPEPNAALIRVTSETLHVQKVYCRYLKTVCWRLWSCTKQPQTLVIPYELRFPWHSMTSCKKIRKIWNFLHEVIERRWKLLSAKLFSPFWALRFYYSTLHF